MRAAEGFGVVCYCYTTKEKVCDESTGFHYLRRVQVVGRGTVLSPVPDRKSFVSLHEESGAGEVEPVPATSFPGIAKGFVPVPVGGLDWTPASIFFPVDEYITDQVPDLKLRDASMQPGSKYIARLTGDHFKTITTSRPSLFIGLNQTEGTKFFFPISERNELCSSIRFSIVHPSWQSHYTVCGTERLVMEDASSLHIFCFPKSAHPLT